MDDSADRESDIMKARELLTQLANLRSWTRRTREAGRRAGEQLCDLYLAADEATKEAIRRLPDETDIGKWRDLLRFVRSCAKRIAKANESEAVVNLQRALAAASIENCGFDFRDTISALGAVERAAFRANLDVPKYLQEAADYSSDRNPYPVPELDNENDSMKRFLEYRVENAQRRARGQKQMTLSELREWEDARRQAAGSKKGVPSSHRSDDP